MSETTTFRMIKDLRQSLDDLEQSLHQGTKNPSGTNTLLGEQAPIADESSKIIQNLMDKQAQEEKLDNKIKEFHREITFKVIMNTEPYIEKLLSSGLNKDQMECLTILRYNLKKITTPTTQFFSNNAIKFTNSETKTLNLIRQGKTSKEIAEFFNLSQRTVDFHRDSIRKKLNLDGTKISLKSYLRSHEM